MKEKTPHFVDILFVLAIFGLFAISALALVTIGANVYQNTVDNMQSNYEIRTSTSYVLEKVRQNENLLLTEIDGQKVLCFPQEINGQEYATYLYCYDGKLKELFTGTANVQGSNMLGAGQSIMDLDSLDFQLVSDRLIKATFTLKNGSDESILLPVYGE